MCFTRSSLFVRCCLLMYCCKVVSADNFKLAIIHTNDVHARFRQTNKYGGECDEEDIEIGKCFDGVARRATKTKELRNNMTNTILLDAGDQFQGTMWYSHYRGAAAAYFMNELEYQAMGLGNHEFDNGVDVLASFADNLTFPLLSSNMDVSNEPRLDGKILKSTVLNVSNERIGVIGYTTIDTPDISKPGDAVKFDEVIVAVRREAEALTADGVNKIVAVGHAGLQVDVELAKEVPHLDIVVGGHTHTFLYTGTKPSNDDPEGPYPTVVRNNDGRDVPVVTAFQFGKYLGYITLEFDASGIVVSWQGSPILLDNSTAQDTKVLADVQRFSAPVDEYKKQVVGSTLVYLEGDTNFCRIAECNMGNLFTDALVWFYQSKASMDKKWTDVAISLANGGSIRSTIVKGPINMADLTTTFPYGNNIDIISLKGEHLLQALEYGASKYSLEQRWGGFFQMSGMHVKYDMKQPIGRRVISVMVLCTKCDMPDYFPLNKTEVYRIALNTFIINGGDGYKSISDNLISKDKRDDLDMTVIKEYIERFSPVVAVAERRIQFFDESECGTSAAARFVDFRHHITIITLAVAILVGCSH